LDCTNGAAATWTRLWPTATSSLAPLPSVTSLPEDLKAKGGGMDALAIISGDDPTSVSTARTRHPRGRMSASITCAADALWIFGGSCESGPRQEVTLDDMWSIQITSGTDGKNIHCASDWECVLPLSDRATVWFDSESEEEDEEEQLNGEGSQIRGDLVPLNNPGGGVLNKRQQKEEAKKMRVEVKKQRQMEKCEDKIDKRDLKRDRQRQQAKAKGQAE